MNQIELKALAKINLGLDVLGRRENGYHDVRMVMQSIYLYDEVKIAKKKEPGIILTTNLKFLPTGRICAYGVRIVCSKRGSRFS